MSKWERKERERDREGKSESEMDGNDNSFCCSLLIGNGGL